MIQEEIESCLVCETSRMIMTGKSSLAKQLTNDTGPDDFYQNITAKDVLTCLIIDECGPFFLKKGEAMQ